MGALRPRNGSTRFIVADALTKKPSVARINSCTCAKKATSRTKQLESPKPSPRRRSLADNVTAVKLSLEESTSVPSAGPSRRVSATVPRMLPRPTYKEPSDEALCAVGFESMIKEDRNIVRMMIDAIVPQFNYMSALYNYKCDVGKGKVPDSVVLDYSQNNALPPVPPTHMLAISSNSNSSSDSPVTLYPTHNSVLAVHCATLPVFPPPLPTQKTLTEKNQIRLPVWQLTVPSPETFPQLLVFLYSKDVSGLFTACLPSPPPMGAEASVASFARQLAQENTFPTLLKHLRSVHGLWLNAVVLRIFDLRLWSTLDLMWSTLLSAIQILRQESASKREGVESTPAPVSLSST